MTSPRSYFHPVRSPTPPRTHHQPLDKIPARSPPRTPASAGSRSNRPDSQTPRTPPLASPRSLPPPSHRRPSSRCRLSTPSSSLSRVPRLESGVAAPSRPRPSPRPSRARLTVARARVSPRAIANHPLSRVSRAPSRPSNAARVTARPRPPVGWIGRDAMRPMRRDYRPYRRRARSSVARISPRARSRRVASLRRVASIARRASRRRVRGRAARRRGGGRRSFRTTTARSRRRG